MEVATVASLACVASQSQPGIWREGLHQLFWARRYGDDLVEIHQAALAEQLQTTRPNMNRIIKAMEADGWIEKVDAKIYRVTDPGCDSPRAG